MTPQDEFEAWYRTAVGITVEEANRRGLKGAKMLRAAFMAGRESGRTTANKEIPQSVKEFWTMAIDAEKKMREREET